MNHRVLKMLCLAGVLGSLLTIACRSDHDGTNVAPTASPAIPSITTTAVPAPSTPIVAGSNVRSEGVGYEALIPPGWHIKPNVLTSTDYRGDAYFKDGTSSPSAPAPNIAVGCRPTSDSTHAVDDVIADQVEALKALRRENIATATRAPVDGHDAREISYVFRLSAVSSTPLAGDDDIVLDKEDVVFVTSMCIWTISLSAPQGMIATESPVLEEFLTTFKELG